MRANRSGRLTYANLVSTLCLFLLVSGGAAVAATQLEKNSVGTQQLKNGAVTLKKIRESARFALRGDRGPAGPRGRPGPIGPKGPQGEAGQSASAFVASSTPSALSSAPFAKGFWLLDSHDGGKDLVIDTKATVVIQGSATIDAAGAGASVPVTCQAYLYDPGAASPQDTPVGVESRVSVTGEEAETISVTGFSKVAAGTWGLRLGCSTSAASGDAVFGGGALTAIATDS